MLQHLAATGDEPHPLGNGHIRVGESLHQRKRGRRRLAHTRSEFIGGGVLPVSVNRYEVGHTIEREIGWQALEQREPALTAFHVDHR